MTPLIAGTFFQQLLEFLKAHEVSICFSSPTQYRRQQANKAKAKAQAVSFSEADNLHEPCGRFGF